MILKKIQLENIRSHLYTEISFGEGKTLLAGNIGAGKSSILLAIDFALFGITRGVLSGNALLRNSKEQGRVCLCLDIDGNEVVIERNLKRTPSGISQDSGSISINNNKTDKSAVELKQAVLEILNYPQELLTKSKGLIYRYTVYTPQEEMKQILLAEPETRLDTLRRVFDIDKYKRIKENAKIFLGLLREKRKGFSALIIDLDDRRKELLSKRFEKSALVKELQNILPVHALVGKEIINVKEMLKSLEEKKETRNSYIKSLEIRQTELAHKALLVEKHEKELFILKQDIATLEDEVKDFNHEEIKEDIKFLDKKIKSDESELKAVVNKASEINAVRGHAKNIISKITGLDFCPTCNQLVSKEHKHTIISKEEANILSLDSEYNNLEAGLFSLEKAIEQDKSKLNSLQVKERKQELFDLKLQYIGQKKAFAFKIEEENRALLSGIEKTNDEIQALKHKISEIGITDYERLKESLDNLLEKEKSLLIQKNTFERDLEHLSLLSEGLEKDINKMEGIKSKLEYLSSFYSWINESFISTIEIMEKKVMLKLHSDFNALFEKWFEMLVGNENLNISLGEDFSPRILQDGYDLEYEHLSGGEKTAAALAYRLALNQVINNLVSNIKTRDLLILDEPTDGFSDEQLDRMKIVLDELRIKQIIIVSHEDKIESFVDKIIRFQKDGHITKILN